MKTATIVVIVEYAILALVAVALEYAVRRRRKTIQKRDALHRIVEAARDIRDAVYGGDELKPGFYRELEKALDEYDVH